MSYFNRFQAQGIGNHGQRTEAHGRCRDNGAEQNAKGWIEYTRSDRYAESVIDKGEKQVLPDIGHGDPGQFPCPDNAAQISLDQGHTC